MTAREKIIEKVRRLRRLETSPHKHESAAAKRAADAIVKKYKLRPDEFAEPKPAPPPAPSPSPERAPSCGRRPRRRAYDERSGADTGAPSGPPSEPSPTGPRVDPFQGGIDYGAYRTSGDFTSEQYREMLRTIFGTTERPGGMPAGFGMPDGFRVTGQRRRG